MRDLVRRFWVPLLLATVFGGYYWIGAPFGPGGGGVPEAWRRGDWWVVTTRVPPSHLRKAPSGWLPGPTYRFTVQRAERWRGQNCWLVRLEQLLAGAGLPSAVADLYYSKHRLVLVGGRYFGPGGQVLPWPEAAAYLRLPVELPRLEGKPEGRPVRLSRRGIDLQAEALDLGPGQTQVWSGQAPWWIRFSLDGVVEAELIDTSWWNRPGRYSLDWRRVLTGPENRAPMSPFSLQQGGLPLPATAPEPAGQAERVGPPAHVAATLRLNGALTAEVRGAELPGRRGTYVLPLYSAAGAQVGVLYCSVLDPAAGRVRLDRLVLTEPEYVDRTLNGMEGVWSASGEIHLAQGDLAVHMERSPLP